MNKFKIWAFLIGIGFSFTVYTFYFTDFKAIEKITKPISENELTKNHDSIPIGLVKLKSSYPEFIHSTDKNSIVWKDGTKMIYDIPEVDTAINFENLLNTADLKDQMEMIYPKGTKYPIPFTDFDPGRIRNEAFFKKIYGSTQNQVAKNLVTIIWLPKTVVKKLSVTKINDVDKKLVAISDELEKHPELLKYIDNPGGAFYWRKIAGTERLSMHSFGIAIDLNVKYSDYWKWDAVKGTGKLAYKNRIPLKIVEIFEKYGFIWGGKWYHYDTMHFEYRPELLI